MTNQQKGEKKKKKKKKKNTKEGCKGLSCDLWGGYATNRATALVFGFQK